MPRPTRNCDVVMRGGVTSGVVYPAALLRLSRAFRIRNIGGTSAGAIAAALGAAAEYGRGAIPSPTRDPFERMDERTAELGKEQRLFRLFQPAPRLRVEFRVAVAIFGKKWGAAVRAAVVGKWFAVLLGAMPGVALALHGATAGDDCDVRVIVSGFLFVIVGALAALVISLIARVIGELPRNRFGLCTGKESPGDEPGLTTWLHRQIQDVAGRTDPGAAPLTFGDLWGTPDPAAPRDINLQMVSTCLTHGRPYGLPFEHRTFSFRESDFRELFPDDVVRHLKAHEPDPAPDDPPLPAGYHRLPEAQDLPMLVAVRMSLSFPLLLSAVRLYARDYTRRDASDQVLEPVWFTDGGLSSNFPIHFFDSALPRWPTFGLNLVRFHLDYPKSPNEADNVWMPDTNGTGLSERWYRFDRWIRERCAPNGDRRAQGCVQGEKEGGAALSGFFGALMNAGLSWSDNLQVRAPGFRDRIAEVKLSAEEGGLNLEMKEEVVEALRRRGAAAADRLISSYTTEPEKGEKRVVSWNNQRFVRMRNLLARLEDLAHEVAEATRDTGSAGKSYASLLEDPPSYKNPWNVEVARDVVQRVVDLEMLLQAASPHLADGEPRPVTDLRIVPKY